MRKDLKDKIDVNPKMAEMSFKKFKAMHEIDHPGDDPEVRYLKIGGVIPKDTPKPKK